MRAYQLAKGGAGVEGLSLVQRPDPKPAKSLRWIGKILAGKPHATAANLMIVISRR